MRGFIHGKFKTTSGGLLGSIAPAELSDKAQLSINKSARLSIPLFEFLENGCTVTEINPDTGKKEKKKVPPPKDNAYLLWKKAQKKVNKYFKSLGEDVPSEEGTRAFYPEEAEEALARVNHMINFEVNPLRDRLISDLPYLVDQLVDRFSYDVASEVRGKLEASVTKFRADTEPFRKWTDLREGTDLVTGQEMQKAIVESRLTERKKMIGNLEDAIIVLFESMQKGVQRVRNENSPEYIDKMIRRAQLAIAEYSEFPDKVERLEKAIDKLKELPATAEGIKKDHSTKLTARQALEIFKTQPEQEEAEQEEVFKTASFNESDELIQDEPLTDEQANEEINRVHEECSAKAPVTMPDDFLF